MACFIVPAAEAAVTTIASKVMHSKEKELHDTEVQKRNSTEEVQETSVRIPFSHKLKWLSNLLWGGSALLAFEHLWHGEIMPWFPFLSAAGDPQAFSEMLHEMATAGVSMAALVTVVWLGMVGVSSAVEKRTRTEKDVKEGA